MCSCKKFTVVCRLCPEEKPGWHRLTQVERILPLKPVYRQVRNHLMAAGLEWELCVLPTKRGSIWLCCSSGFCAIAGSVYLYI